VGRPVDVAQARHCARALGNVLIGGAVDAGRAVASERLGACALRPPARVGRASKQRSVALPRFASSFAYFQRMISGGRVRRSRRPRGLGDPFGALVDPPAARRGRAPLASERRSTGRRRARRAGPPVDEHAVDVRKAPQREPLVLDAVLRADQPELIQASEASCSSAPASPGSSSTARPYPLR